MRAMLINKQRSLSCTDEGLGMAALASKRSLGASNTSEARTVHQVLRKVLKMLRVNDMTGMGVTCCYSHASCRAGV